MFKQLKWAFTHAFYANVVFTVALEMLGIMLLTGPNPMKAIGVFLMIVPVLLIAVSMQHHCDIYRVQRVIDPTTGMGIEIGHVEAFKERYQVREIHGKYHIGHTGASEFGTNRIHAMLLDNGLLIVASGITSFQICNVILKRNWAFYRLIETAQQKELPQFWISETPEETSMA